MEWAISTLISPLIVVVILELVKIMYFCNTIEARRPEYSGIGGQGNAKDIDRSS